MEDPDLISGDQQALVLGGAYAPAVLRCGYLHHHQVLEERFRGRRSYRLIGVIDGVMDLHPAHEDGAFGPGSVLLLPPGGDRLLRYGLNCTVLHAVFDVEPVQRRRSEHGDWVHVAPVRAQPSPRQVWGVDLPLRIPAELGAAGLGCLQLLRAMYWRSSAGYARACGHLAGFLGDLAYHCEHRQQASAAAGGDSALLQRALQFLDDPQAAPLSVQAVAAMAGVSREHLSRLTRRHLGRSLREVIQIRRQEMACRLLLDTQLSVEEIAASLGYQHPPSFDRAFRRWLGVTPSDYRRRL